MASRDRFSSELKCPECGKTGTVSLSQADGYAYIHDKSTSIDHLPEGFRFVRVSGIFDLEFYCISCNVKVPD